MTEKPPTAEYEPVADRSNELTAKHVLIIALVWMSLIFLYVGAPVVNGALERLWTAMQKLH